MSTVRQEYDLGNYIHVHFNWQTKDIQSNWHLLIKPFVSVCTLWTLKRTSQRWKLASAWAQSDTRTWWRHTETHLQNNTSTVSRRLVLSFSNLGLKHNEEVSGSSQLTLFQCKTVNQQLTQATVPHSTTQRCGWCRSYAHETLIHQFARFTGQLSSYLSCFSPSELISMLAFPLKSMCIKKFEVITSSWPRET